LSRVGEVVKLYEEIEHLLRGMDHDVLVRIAHKRAPGERPLALWARRIHQDRDVESDRDLEIPPLRSRRSSALLWEALAFALGFGMSVLMIVKGA
jgi:hypothetical protein